LNISIRVRAFGSISALLDARDQLEEACAAWRPLALICVSDVQLIRASAELTDHTLVLVESHFGQSLKAAAAGCSLDPQDAVSRAIGEIVERAFTRCMTATEERYATARELIAAGCRTFDVAAFIGIPAHPESWPFAAYADDRVLAWVPGTNLCTGATVWVPRSLVELTPVEAADGLCEITTVGVAAGQRLEYATENAVMELYERHVLMLAWWKRQQLVPVEAAGNRELAAAAEHDQDTGWQTILLRTPEEHGGPVVVLALSRHDQLRRYAIGSAASRAGTGVAAAHAVAECMHLRMRTRFVRTRTSGLPENFSDRLSYYESDDGARMLARHFDGTALTGQVPTTDQSPFHGLVRVELSPPGGPYVVRVLGTNFCHMPANEAHARINPVVTSTWPALPHPYG
jgi:ribosomal protein S12 methylthiotransferase accessory factor YcaO